MTIASDLFDAGFDLLEEVLGTVAGTYSQSLNGGAANTKAISSGVTRTRVVRSVGENLDEDTCSFLIEVSQFASGFSGANPVHPSAGDTYTVSGEGIWTIGDGDAALYIQGSFWVLRATRHRTRGVT